MDIIGSRCNGRCICCWSSYRDRGELMRAPDKIIGIDYLWRWYLIPQNRFFNIYLHRFLRSDDERALHDHPWCSVSVLLRGLIWEIVRDPESGLDLPNYNIRRFIPVYRNAKHAHRIILESKDAWTLFITGRKIREWGFYCPNGWRHWEVFTTDDGNQIGRGCE